MVYKGNKMVKKEIKQALRVVVKTVKIMNLITEKMFSIFLKTFEFLQFSRIKIL